MPLFRPKSSGGGITIGTTVITGGTQGSVLFIGAGLVAQQDNPNLFFDDTNNRLGIGTTASPHFRLDVGGDIRIRSTSALYFGGTGAADNDVNLYRSAANVLKTDDSLTVATAAYFGIDGVFYVGLNAANANYQNIAIGYEANSSGGTKGDSIVVIGDQAGKGSNIGTNSILIGRSAGVGSTAIGTDVIILGNAGIGAVTYANYGINIGQASTVTGVEGIGIGKSATVSGTNGIAIATSSNASGTDAIAIGRAASSSGTDTIVIGRAGSSSAQRNVVIGGTAATSSGENSVVIGYGSTSANGQNTVLGSLAIAGSGNNNIIIGYNSTVTSGNAHVAIGNEISAANGANDVIMIGRYNRQVNDGSITLIMDTAARTNRVGAGDTVIGAYSHSSSDVGSSGFNTMIGYNQQMNYGGNFANCTIIGRNSRIAMDTGGNYSNAIGAYTRVGNSAAACTEGVMVFGTGDGTNYLTNIENNSLIFGFKDQYESLKLYKRGMLVFNGANAASIVDGTNCDASATNTITIPNGTAPAASPADAFAMYSSDAAAGNACPTFRTENAEIIKLYKSSTFTQTYSTASTTIAVNTGIDNAQVGSVYASVADLDNVTKNVNAIIDALQLNGILG